MASKIENELKIIKVENSEMYNSQIFDLRIKTLKIMGCSLPMVIEINIIEGEQKYFVSAENKMYLTADIFRKDERYFIFCHELFHILYKHCERTAMIIDENFNFDVWTIACEHTVNKAVIELSKLYETNILKDLLNKGFKAPILYDEIVNKDLSTEGVYRYLLKNKNSMKSKLDGMMKQIKDLNLDGDFEIKLDPTKEKSESNIDVDLYNKELVESTKKIIGSGTNGILREISKVEKINVDIFKKLDNFATEVIMGSDESTWLRESSCSRILKSSLGINTRLPKRYSVKLEFVCIIDTSGSISPKLLNKFASFINSLLLRDANVYCVVVDDKIHFSKYIKDVKELDVRGGGGTDLRLGYKEIMDNKLEPMAIFCLTDGYTPWPDGELLKYISKFQNLIVYMESGAAEPPKFGKIYEV